MSRKDHFFQLVTREKERIQGLGVKEIGLFGSVVRGEDTENSDYDVLVGFDRAKKSYRNFLSLVDLLEEGLKNEVELVTKESLSPYMAPYILEEVEYAPIAS